KYAANLYFSSYSYKYNSNESIVIMNNKETKQKLWALLAESLLLTVLAEVSIVIISRLITKWITKPAEEAFERQKEFVADASHELKTPLAVIMASADEIQNSNNDPKYIENIRYESDRMNKLITGLLNLSRLESGEDIVSFKEEDLSRILEKSCMAYEAVAFEQGVSVYTDIEEGLTCKCNKEEIEQMAATLLDNAVRHSYKDSTVKILASAGKGIIDIRVINTGDPIPKEDEERIFERFYRGDKARGRSENRYGLGLAIARRIARNHNGDIKAYSENGETIFRVTLRK
nr:HAMP domain-containing histidine kinase [Lachnospiraceae bacterium]